MCALKLLRLVVSSICYCFVLSTIWSVSQYVVGMRVNFCQMSELNFKWCKASTVQPVIHLTFIHYQLSKSKTFNILLHLVTTNNFMKLHLLQRENSQKSLLFLSFISRISSFTKSDWSEQTTLLLISQCTFWFCTARIDRDFQWLFVFENIF